MSAASSRPRLWLFALLFVSLLSLPPAPLFAQETAPAADNAPASQEADRTLDAATSAAAGAPAVTAARGATDGALQVESAETYRAALTDPGISQRELALRILPLTAAQLTTLADDWLTIVQGQITAVVTEQLAIRQAEAGGASAPRDRLTVLTAQRNRGFANLMTVVNGLELKGGSPEAIAGYRDFRNAVLVEETQAADWRSLMSYLSSWAVDTEGGIAWLKQGAIVVAAFAALILVARFVRRVARNGIRRIPTLSKLLQSFLVMVVYWLTLAVGLMIVLGALGVNVTPLFALLGGASFILAFATQNTLSNLAAGLMIMFTRPFDVGDYVSIAGTSGTVASVSVVATTVTTPDNQVIVIPNSKVWGDVITNVTASDTRRVDLVFGIGYGDSIETAHHVLQELVQAHPGVLQDPTPLIRVNELAESSVKFIVRPWVKSADYWTVHWDLTRQVKERFDAAGISIPYPQTDMHMHIGGASALAAAAAASEPAPGMGHSDDAPGDRRGGAASGGDAGGGDAVAKDLDSPENR